MKKNKEGEREKTASKLCCKNPYVDGGATVQRKSNICHSFMGKLGSGKAEKEDKMKQLMREGIEDWNNYIDHLTELNCKNDQEMEQRICVVCFFDWFQCFSDRRTMKALSNCF